MAHVQTVSNLDCYFLVLGLYNSSQPAKRILMFSFFKISASMAIVFACITSTAQQKEVVLDKHVKAAITDHQKMAKAHSDAAQCLASGKDEKECHKQMAKDCPDVGIGKYCGMKHRH
jgi:hypothetical protein